MIIFTFALQSTNMKKGIIFSVLSLSLGFLIISHFSCVKDVGPLPAKITIAFCDSLNVKYSTDINQIMTTYCSTTKASCHGPFSSNGDFSNYAGLQPYANNGSLRDRVLVLKDMPQGGPPLADSLLQKIDCWLQKGFPNN